MTYLYIYILFDATLHRLIVTHIAQIYVLGFEHVNNGTQKITPHKQKPKTGSNMIVIAFNKKN